MELKLVDGNVQYIQPSKKSREQIAEIKKRLFQSQNYQMKNNNSEAKESQLVKTILCFDCCQAVVEFKNQICETCVQKRQNLEMIIVHPIVVIVFMVTISFTIFLFFAWLFTNFQFSKIEPVNRINHHTESANR